MRQEVHVTEIIPPATELRKAYDLGSEAAKEGKGPDACPFALPTMRLHWDSGYAAIKQWLGAK